MKAFLFVLLSACISLSACKKDSTQITKDKLVGAWNEKEPIIGFADSLQFSADNTAYLSRYGTTFNYSFASSDSIVFSNTNGAVWQGFKLHFVTDTELIIDRYQDAGGIETYPVTLQKQE